MRKLSFIYYAFITLFVETTTYRLPSGLIQMTPNTLNGARFYQLRRSPKKNLTQEFIETPIAPTIICTNEKIGIQLNEHFSDVRIFASGRSMISDCRRNFSLEFEPIFTASYNGPCGVVRRYTGAPSLFLEYSIRLIVSHNPEEITEKDKIYDISCTQNLQSMEMIVDYTVTGGNISNFNKNKALPKCKYSLHHKNYNGPKTSAAKVGDLIVHRWKCSSSNYFYKVYNCIVNDEKNRTYSILDENGCSIDEEIIPTPQYDIDNGVIYTPTKAFRFANSHHVHFKCMISLCPKGEPSCFLNTQLKCNSKSHKKRDLAQEVNIEQRLWRIHELMKKNNASSIMSSKSAHPVAVLSSDPIVVTENNISQYEETILHYRLWTWTLCVINIILVVISILLTCRLFKNKYIMDIKDQKNTIFRRSPF